MASSSAKPDCQAPAPEGSGEGQGPLGLALQIAEKKCRNLEKRKVIIHHFSSNFYFGGNKENVSDELLRGKLFSGKVQQKLGALHLVQASFLHIFIFLKTQQEKA